MRKALLFLVVALGFMPTAFSQTKDNVARECVLFEIFTGVRCQYCPAAANGVAQMLEEGLAIAPVAYHTSAFSTAEFYTNETNARASYYGIASYPTLKADGVLTVEGGGHASENMYSYYISRYNQRVNVASPFTIDLSLEPVDGTTCRVNCTVTQVGECSGNDVRVFIALTQCNLDVTWQGMHGLHHVCRDMIPSQLGTSFTGPTMTISETINMVYPKEDCYLTAWVQNYSGGNKEVYQAVRMSTQMDLDYDLVLKSVDNVIAQSCSGSQKPMLTVKNFGNETVTTFDMCVNDGQTVHRQQWQGNLAQGETVEVEMDEITVASCDALQFYVELPNGHEDGFAADNGKTVSVEEVFTIDGYLKLQLKTGAHPENLTIELIDTETEEVVKSYTYEQANHNYAEDIELLNGGCYRIEVRDAAGEGMSNGFFQFKDADGRVIMKGGGTAMPFTYVMKTEVYCDGTLSVDEPTTALPKVYPNPFHGSLSLALGDCQWQVAVYDITGRKVFESQCSGKSTLDLSQLRQGLYFLKALQGEKEYNTKIMMQ